LRKEEIESEKEILFLFLCTKTGTIFLIALLQKRFENIDEEKYWNLFSRKKKNKMSHNYRLFYEESWN
jgi:hypothetical protein